MFFGGHKVAKILYIYIYIYSPIFTTVKPYSYHGEDTAAADPSRRKEHFHVPNPLHLAKLRPSKPLHLRAAALRLSAERVSELPRALPAVTMVTIGLSPW